MRGAALRRRWSPLALGLLGHWRRGEPPLVPFPRFPGGVIDLGSSLLSPAPCLREGGTDFWATPTAAPPPACPCTRDCRGSRLAGRW